jgi:replicative DNA helicase
MVEQNRITAIEATSSLDLIKDDFKPMLDKIVEKYDRKNTTPTGYTIFDDYVFNGGFERSRLYIFAGTAGSGKSTLMGNLIINSARKSSFMYDQNENKKDGIYKVYIYITLENTIEEAFMRIYQSLYNKKTHDVLNDIINGVNIKKMIVDEFEKNNATIIMKYFKPGMVSCTDLMVVLDDVIEEYGQLAIKGLYVDYLDVLRNDTRYDVKWMEIGEIALSLKLLAVDYNIPVITPTHLDRSAYTAENIKNINLGNLAKSIQKAEHGDTVCIQINDQFDPKIIHTKVIKNRSGRSNIAIDFNVDFDYYKFINGFRADGEKLNNQESYNNIIDYSDNSSNGF